MSSRWSWWSSPDSPPAGSVTAMFLVDAAVAAASLSAALALTAQERTGPWGLSLVAVYALPFVAARLTVNAALRVHRWSFRFSGLEDAARVTLAVLLGSILAVPLTSLFGLTRLPAATVLLEMLLTGSLMIAVRFAPRLLLAHSTQLHRVRRGDGRRTLIVGAGAAGEMLYRDLRQSGGHQYVVVGFVDDDRAKWGALVGGKRVFGGLDSLRTTIERQRIECVLIAVPRSSPSVARAVMSRCSGLDIHIKALPVSFVYLRERSAASMLRDLSPEDLLARAPVSFSAVERSAVAGRRVLVTGAAGSIGSEICDQLLGLGVDTLAAIDKNENGLYLLEQRLRARHPAARIRTEIADIRDQSRVEYLIRDVRPFDIFHAAAHKHVPLMELTPCEAVKNNVTGTRHVLRAAEKFGVECLVFISSDKAVAPTSVMGVTKRVGELMTRATARRSNLWGCSVRFGNVLGSDGSVVPLFRQQIEAGGPLTVTHPDVRRYFMTIPEAVGLVLKAAYGRFGELCVLDMGEPVRILDLAHHMIKMAGCVPDVDIPIVITGLRPGEKLNEELVTEEEEVVERADSKIRVVSGPPPPRDLWHLIEQLEAAAAAEDTARVLSLLKIAVPTYSGSLDRTLQAAS